MRKPFPFILSIVFLLFSGILLRAQSQDSFYRGQGSLEYSFKYNGNPFWQNSQFRPGTVFYNGKQYSGIDLNINAHKQILMLRRPGDLKWSLDLPSDKVSWFTIGDTTYINPSLLKIDGAPDGFEEVLADGSSLLVKKVEKHLKAGTKDANGDVIGYYDSSFDPRISSMFERKVLYGVIKDGTYYPVKTKKDMVSTFPDHKKEIRRIPQKDFEAFAVNAMRVVDSGTASSLATYTNVQSFRKWPVQTENTDYIDNLIDDPLPGGTGDELPMGWFILPDETTSNVVQYVSGKVVKVTLQNKLYEVGDKTRPARGKVTVSGYVYNSANDETLPGVVVYDNVTNTYAQTDAKGFYSISLPTGENVLNFSETTMDDFHAMVSVYDQARVDVVMNEKSILLNEAMISSETREKHRTTKMGMEKMSVKTMRKVPMAFGEGDVLKAVQTLPGVQSVGEASSGINVRGGSVDQNLILFNGNTIYNPSHMFGLFSSFNPDIVDNLELYKGSIPVEYGGRISSVLDVRGKAGNLEKFTGSIGLGVLSSHLSLEGPISKGKTSFILGARTTYSDWLLGLIPTSSNYSGGSADFTDLNAGILHKFSDRSSIRADIYWSKDGFSFGRDTSFRYANLNASLKYDQKIGDASSMALSLGYDQYSNTLKDRADSLASYRYSSVIRQFFLKDAFQTKLGDRHLLSYGLQTMMYIMGRGDLDPYGEWSLITSRSLGDEKALEGAVWLGDAWQMTDKLSLEYGGRMSGFRSQESGKTYFNPEGRISSKYTFNPSFSLKAGAGTTSQYVNLISNSASISPMDTWRLANENIKPQTGWQAALGAYFTSRSGKIDLSAEAYWKRTYNYLDYKSGATLIMNENLADDLVETTGKAYGLELMAKKSAGKLNGWISYTWSRSFLQDMDNEGVQAINGGNWYNAPFDKPHNLNIVANYNLTHRFSFSLNVDYSTGRPVTIPVGKYYMGGGYILAYSQRNEYRIPDYFRMDAAMNVEPGHYLKALTHWYITFGVYNLTGRKNAYSVYYATKGTELSGYMVSVFATQIPYLSINIKF